MIAPKVASEQGPAIDEFLSSTIKTNAGFVECTQCGVVHETTSFTPEHAQKDPMLDLSKWKFSLMGLMPSRFFRTVRGICPTCQEFRKNFKGVFSQ